MGDFASLLYFPFYFIVFSYLFPTRDLLGFQQNESLKGIIELTELTETLFVYLFLIEV